MNRYSAADIKLMRKYILDSNLRNSLSSIRRVIEDIWASEAPRIVKNFPDHGINHSERLANFAYKLLQTSPKKNFSEQEIYLLLAGIYLHDIGMQCDVVKFPEIKAGAEALGAKFDVEFTAKISSDYSLEEQKEIRKSHQYLSAAWIDYAYRNITSKLHSAISTVPGYMVKDLIDVCIYHSKLSIIDCPECFQFNPNGRKRMISALLRFADELDIDSRRISIETIEYFSLEPRDMFFWWVPHNTTITFSDSNAIRIIVRLHPDDYKYKSYFYEMSIIKFKTKNQAVMDALVKEIIPIIIDSKSAVVEDNFALKCPLVVREYLDSQINKPSVPPDTEKNPQPVSPWNVVTKIHYIPQEPPNVSDFFDRTTYIEKFSKHLDGNIIVIQGMPGIGKSSLAAKLKDTLDSEKKYITSWREIYSSDNFRNISHYFAGLMKETGNCKLAKEIEEGEEDNGKITEIICDELMNNKYIIFLDNFHANTDENVRHLFERICEKQGMSTFIFVTRYKPPFITEVDIRMKKVISEVVEGFDYEVTTKYLDSLHVTLNDTQRTLLYQKIGGHPLFNLVIKNLISEDEFDEIIYNIPNSEIGDYLYKNIYKILDEDEQNLLEIMSVFRRPFTPEACIYISKKENVKKALQSLKDKTLVTKKKGNYYHLHDTVRDYAYSLIDRPTSYHQLAAKYYSTLDKTYENIEETIYHSIKSNEPLCEDIIKYLLETPSDVSIDLLIVSVFQNNSTKSPLFFDLIRKVSSNQSLEIKRLAVNALVKNKDLDAKKALSIIKEFISDKDPQLRSTSINLLGQFFERYLEDCIYIIDEIVLHGNPKDTLYLCYAIKDSECNNETIRSVLKDISTSDKEKVDTNSKLLAKSILKELNLSTDSHKEGYEPNTVLKKPSSIKSLDDLIFGCNEFNRFNLNYIHIIKLLETFYESDKEYVTKLMKKMIIYSTENQRVELIIPISTALLSSEGFYYESVKSFVEDNNLYVRITGFLAVIQAYTCAVFFGNKYNVEGEEFVNFIELLGKNSINIMKLLTDESLKIQNDEPLREMATIFMEEICNPSKKQEQKFSEWIKERLAAAAISLLDYARATNTEKHPIHMMVFVAFMAFTNIEPEKTYHVWESKENSKIIRRMLPYYFNTVRNSPTDILNLIKKSGLYSPLFLDRSYSIYRTSIISIAIPTDVINLYEKLLMDPLYQDKELKIMILFSLSLIQNRVNLLEKYGVEKCKELDTIKMSVQRLTQNLLDDENKEVQMFAEIVINENI